MPALLLFPRDREAADLYTFARRAALAGDGIVRLQASGGVLVASCATLAAQSLIEPTPTILAMRMLAVDAELVCDVAVDAVALVPADDPRAIVLPEVGRAPAWAGISPPRSGWEPDGVLDVRVLRERAQWGSAAVARALPDSPGEALVHQTRTRIWGEPDAQLDGLPRGTAFAAEALGFLGGERGFLAEGEQAQLWHAGAWRRISLRRGHLLTRSPQGVGLTPVRATGPSRS